MGQAIITKTINKLNPPPYDNYFKCMYFCNILVNMIVLILFARYTVDVNFFRNDIRLISQWFSIRVK